MPFTTKNWVDAPSTSTPITAAALEDLESRLAAYTDRKTFVNVTEPPYNAVGNGSNDDSAEIQAAIDAVNTAGGGTVFIPKTANYYKIVAEILMKDGVRLTGEGYGSCLQKDATDNNDVISATGISNFEIDHLRVRNSTMAAELLDPGLGSAFAIRVTDDCSKGWVHHNFVERSCFGIGVLDLSPGTPSNEIDVTDNYVWNCGINGIGVACFGTDICVERNQIRNYGQEATLSLIGAGIEWAGPIGGSCSHNLIRDGDYGSDRAIDGIRISDFAVTDLMCVGNDISNTSGYLIRISTSMKRSVVGFNRLRTTTNFGSGIYVISDVSGDIEQNSFPHNVISDVDVGLLLEGSHASTSVHDNDFEGTVVTDSTSGIVLNVGTTPCNDNDFRGGHIKGCSNYGVNHGAGSRNRFREVVVRESVGFGFHIAGTEVELIECHAYDRRGTKLQTYGLNVAAGATGTQVVGGRYGPNLTGTVQDAGTSTVQTGVRAAYS